MTPPLSERYRIPARACAAAMMLTALQGCIAAAAIPVVAGGAIASAETRRLSSSNQNTVRSTTSAPAQIAENAETATPAKETASSTETEAQELSLAQLAAAEFAAQSQAKPTEDAAIVEEETDLEPAPSVFADMTAYVLDILSNDQSSKASESALLIDPSRLDARRTKCGVASNSSAKRPPAVLIDLDDKNGVFDPTAIAPTYDGDAYGHLSRLREAGVTIGWMSALTAADAGGIRKALQASGLDVEGKDELVLFRYPDDRKQTRRGEFGAAHCVIAIAGDDRSDFDELYQYLINPSSAATLEPLIGNGWFLLPTGLSMRSAAPDASETAVTDPDADTLIKADPNTLAEQEAELPPLN